MKSTNTPDRDVGSSDSSAIRWAVYPCGWKWEIGNMTRETESPIALFVHRHHAEDFCREWWPQLGEVRSLPNARDEQRAGTEK